MFLCYFVFNYPAYKQLVHLSTRTKTFLCYFVFNYPVYKQLVHLSTRQLVNSSTRTKTFLCYFVLNYPAYKQLVHSLTRQLVQKRSYVTLSLITLPTSNLFTCQLVNLSTRQLVNLSTRQLVNLSTRTKTLCLNKRIYIYIIRRQKSVKFNYFSNLLICRSLAIICKQGKLLICRHTLQATDLHNITNKENQAK